MKKILSILLFLSFAGCVQAQSGYHSYGWKRLIAAPYGLTDFTDTLGLVFDTNAVGGRTDTLRMPWDSNTVLSYDGHLHWKWVPVTGISRIYGRYPIQIYGTDSVAWNPNLLTKVTISPATDDTPLVIHANNSAGEVPIFTAWSSGGSPMKLFQIGDDGEIYFAPTGGLIDGSGSAGSAGQVLESQGSVTLTPLWTTLPSPGMSNPMSVLGDIIYENSTPAPARLAGQTTTTKEYLSQTGTGTISAAPAWAQVNYSDLGGTEPVPSTAVITNPATTARNTITPPANVVPVTIDNGNGTYTSDLQDWKANGALKASMSYAGALTAQDATLSDGMLNLGTSASSSGEIYFYNSVNASHGELTSGITANRIYTLPDATGTVAIVGSGGGLLTAGTGVTITNSGGATTIAATGSGGTVTSFSSGNFSPLFNTSVATATTTPALSFSAINQNANLVFAGPSSGAAAAPTFRSLVAADLPGGSIVNSVTNSDGSLTISPTTGSVVASLNTANANAFTAVQTFENASDLGAGDNHVITLNNTYAATAGHQEFPPGIQSQGQYYNGSVSTTFYGYEGMEVAPISGTATSKSYIWRIGGSSPPIVATLSDNGIYSVAAGYQIGGTPATKGSYGVGGDPVQGKLLAADGTKMVYGTISTADFPAHDTLLRIQIDMTTFPYPNSPPAAAPSFTIPSSFGETHFLPVAAWIGSETSYWTAGLGIQMNVGTTGPNFTDFITTATIPHGTSNFNLITSSLTAWTQTDVGSALMVADGATYNRIRIAPTPTFTAGPPDWYVDLYILGEYRP
ncbi:MAG: hypothetical protein KGJ13_05740 [Patescibacteria group bacterium]|nr:hypothetical protein [Patescibacteria group bacterium]